MIAVAVVTLAILLSFAPMAQAVITVTDLGSNQQDCCAGGFTLDIITTAEAPAGSSIIIGSTAGGSDGNPSSAVCSDNVAHVYTTDVQLANTDFGVSSICSTHKIAAALPAGSKLTITWTGGVGLTKRARAIAVTGLASNPLDRMAANQGDSPPPPSSGPGGLTSQANELLIGLITDFDAPAGTAGFNPGTNGGEGTNNCAPGGTPTYLPVGPGVGTTVPPSLFLMYCIVSAIDNYSANATISSTWQALFATFRAALPPTITKPFGAASIALNGTTSLSFTITNPNAATPLTVSFNDGLAPGLVVATPNGLTGSCGGGTITATPGSSTISLVGGTIAAGASCTFSVNVTGTTAGVKPNSTTVNSFEAGPGNTATSSLTVVGPPSVTKVFGAASISTGAATTLTFTLLNPNAASALSGVGFTDPLPAGLVVASPNGLTGSCGGGTITATAGSSTISLAGATLAAGASCTFTVSVTATAAGAKNNTTTAVTSTEGGPGNTASASINVVAAAIPAVPALSTVGQVLVVMIVMLTGLLFLRRRLAGGR